MYKKETLKNGLRIILTPVAEAKSAVVSFYFKAGARFESKENNGVAHFLEHMAFKGTEKYPTSMELAKVVEGFGGSWNASTSDEVIEYFIRAEPSNITTVFDILHQMLFKPLFNSKEIEKEKGVIIEEIRMYEDHPQAKVHQMNESILWPNHPLGRNIAGTAESVNSFTRDHFIAHSKKFFVPSNLVIGISGKFDEKEVLELCNKYFSELEDSKVGEPELFVDKQGGPQTIGENKKLEQTNLSISFRGYKRSDPKRYILYLVSMLLGGGMSSRLFQRIREEMGLAYSIYSITSSFFDAGSFYINAGVSNAQYKEAIKAITAEILTLVSNGVEDEELQRNKNHFKGAFALDLEDHERFNEFICTQELLSDKVLTYEDVVAKIE
jgi:predicted Zn-dependent peptidase